MKLTDFNYELPEHLIAQTPLEKRDHSKLLILEKNWTLHDSFFYNLADILNENHVLILNETRTLPARLWAEIDIYPNGVHTTKIIEILLHKQINHFTWECLGPGNNLKIGRTLRFFNNEKTLLFTGHIDCVSNMGRFITFSIWWYDFLEAISKIGEMPLPHYITSQLKDTERYQTVYSQTYGSAATPTAWLHFTPELLKKLEEKWVIIEKILLHVGVGTFKPVEVENIEEHYMHSEYIEIKPEVAQRLNDYKKAGKNIIAVWTTCVRTLESFSDEHGILWYWQKETSIFIYPWYNWRFVNSIITNFHLPCSTLLMLISSLWGYENIMKAYQHAIKKEYRFFSFGDAMWIQ